MSARSLCIATAVWLMLLGCGDGIPAVIDARDSAVADLGPPDVGVGPDEDMGALPICADPQVPAGGTSCSSTMPASSPALCAGAFCDYRPCDVAAGVTPDAACGSASEFARVCDASLTVQVGICARNNAFVPDPPAATRACMRGMFDVATVGDACLDCYVDGAVCARTFCALICLGSDLDACDACRDANGCNERFSTCSGYPNPNGPTR